MEIIFIFSSNSFFQVNCNGQLWFTYRHRIPVQAVQALQVKGDVSISNVRVF